MIFLLALAAGVHLDFSMAIKYETSAITASKSAMVATPPPKRYTLYRSTYM